MDLALEQRHLRQCRTGDATAFRPLVDAYWGRAVRLARALVGDEEDARDIAQESFVAAYRSLAQHREDAPFYPWLRGILLNRSKVFIRSRTRARARREAAAQRPGHWAAPGIARADDAETTELVRKALARLDPESRELLVLKHVEDYTYEELARELAIPAGTIMSRLYRARRALREILEDLGGAGHAGGEEERG